MVARTHSRCTRSDKLERLFADWVKSYPATHRNDFHKDGIVDEGVYRREGTRVLYVLLEPNSKGGRYDQYRGADLRKVWGDVGLGKSFDLNVARWTAVLLDGATKYFTPDAGQAKQQLRRVAIMNLKKLAGSGTANCEAVSVQAWTDRDYVRRQVAIIEPTLVVTCGVTANRLFAWIIKDDPLEEFPEESVWRHGAFQVLPANHPSLRPKNAPAAFARVVQRALHAKVGAFVTK
jgi:hypothetical protein